MNQYRKYCANKYCANKNCAKPLLILKQKSFAHYFLCSRHKTSFKSYFFKCFLLNFKQEYFYDYIFNRPEISVTKLIEAYSNHSIKFLMNSTGYSANKDQQINQLIF